MLKLNDNNIAVAQIKQILHDFNLPTCEIGRKNPTKDRHFIYENYFCKWKADAEDDATLTLQKLVPYKLNKAYLNLTTNLPIRNMLYDAETHRYLGRYLRFLRDYHNINLMSMYNCFDHSRLDMNQFKNGLNLELGSVATTATDGTTAAAETSSKKSVFSDATPENSYSSLISFNPLTIAMNGATSAHIGIYISGVDKNSEENIDGGITAFNTLLLTATTRKIVKNEIVQLDLPAIVQTLPVDEVTLDKYLGYLSKYSNQLSIIIKIDSNDIPNICILEGLYTKQSSLASKYFVMRPFEYRYSQIYAMSEESKNRRIIAYGANGNGYILLSTDVIDPQPGSEYFASDLLQSGFIIKPQLLHYISQAETCYLVADRLLEYLSGNVIWPLSNTHEIKRLQKALIENDLNTFKSKNYRFGIWNVEDLLNLRKFLTTKATKLVNTYDVLGYVDKDVEKLLGGILDNVSI